MTPTRNREDIVRPIDEQPLIMIARFGFGGLIIPILTFLSPGAREDWRLILFFVMMLFALRVVPAVLRHALPFSNETQARWWKLRVYAKQFDSYQWRKLLAIGLGMGTYIAFTGAVGRDEIFLAASCIVAGLCGEIVWRRTVSSGAVSVL